MVSCVSHYTSSAYVSSAVLIIAALCKRKKAKKGLGRDLNQEPKKNQCILAFGLMGRTAYN